MTVRDEPSNQDACFEDNPIWQRDNAVLHSVGIDIGSASTQITFSRLRLRRRSEYLTSRYVVVSREILFQSDVCLTPYTDDLRIDAVALGTLLDTAYADAGQRPENIDTGVVILTGEALRRPNAEPIASVVAQRAGDLVCATAGHHMEAMLAAHGSGAVRLSYGQSAPILHVDIGGGTTKLALIVDGRVVGTSALHVGGRLLVLEANGIVTHLEPAGRDHAARCGVSPEVGGHVGPGDLDLLADSMAARVITAIQGRRDPEQPGPHDLTDPLDIPRHLHGVSFSGGVGEYVYGRETRDFGDLGHRLGAALRHRIEAGELPAPLLPAAERIRATVIGASQYSVQLSGITSYLPSPERTLPRRNLQVVRPSYKLGDEVDARVVTAALSQRLAAFDLDACDEDIALALTWSGPPEYGRLRAFATAVRSGMAQRLDRGLPLYLVIDADIALTLGTILREELAVSNDLLILDGVELQDFDYIDLGRPRQPSNTVPVTIKSLAFGDAMPR